MTKIHYARVDEFWRKEQKYAYLEEKQHVGNVEWKQVSPDTKHNWLLLGREDDFEDFMPVGNKETKTSSSVSAVFKTFSREQKLRGTTGCITFNASISAKMSDGSLKRTTNKL